MTGRSENARVIVNETTNRQRVYRQLVKTYPEVDESYNARTTIADIYHHKLGKLQSAIDWYQKLVSEFPQPFATSGRCTDSREQLSATPS